MATAPSLTDANAAAASPTDEGVATSTSVPRDVTARGLHSECVVCQDAEVTGLHLLSCYSMLTSVIGWVIGTEFVPFAHMKVRLFVIVGRSSLLWTSVLSLCSGPVRLPREMRGIDRCV